VTEIGLKSDNWHGLATLGTGVTNEHFHWLGTMPSDSDRVTANGYAHPSEGSWPLIVRCSSNPGGCRGSIMGVEIVEDKYFWGRINLPFNFL